MWKIEKEDSKDLGFAISCLFSQAVNLMEFKRWLEKVITDMPLEKIPFYIYDLIEFDIHLSDIFNVIGFSTSSKLSKQQDDAIIGIAFSRNIDIYDPPITKEKALKALRENPQVIEEFKRFFPFIDLPPLSK